MQDVEITGSQLRGRLPPAPSPGGSSGQEEKERGSDVLSAVSLACLPDALPTESHVLICCLEFESRKGI